MGARYNSHDKTTDGSGHRGEAKRRSVSNEFENCYMDQAGVARVE